MKTVKELNDQVHNFTVQQYTIDAVQEVYMEVNEGCGENYLKIKSYELETVLEIINPELEEDIQVLVDIKELLERLVTDIEVKYKKADSPFIIDEMGQYENPNEPLPWFIQVKPEGKLPHQLDK